jgi:threonine-phosphate decarboxylase
MEPLTKPLFRHSGTHSYTRAPDHGGDVWGASSLLGIPLTSILDFSASVNPLGTSPRAADAIKDAIKFLHFYPNNDCSPLKDAIASYIERVSSENILVANGSTEIIHLFSQVFLERGDEVIILQPTFSEYEYAVIQNGAKPIAVQMEKGFRLDAEVLLKSVTPRTRAIVLCNPNNPTSTTLDRSDVEEIVEEAAKKKIMVLLDECFIEFVEDYENVSLSRDSKDYGNLLVLRSLTKAFGLAGLRIGYALSNKETVTLLNKFKVTWSVNTLAQAAGVAAVSDAKYLDETKHLIRKERTYLQESLPEIGVSITPPKANFMLANLQGRMTAHELKQRLLTHRILIRDCSAFRGLNSRFVRFAVRTRKDNLALLRALREELRD